jgi:hypothetical protein
MIRRALLMICIAIEKKFMTDKGRIENTDPKATTVTTEYYSKDS